MQKPAAAIRLGPPRSRSEISIVAVVAPGGRDDLLANRSCFPCSFAGGAYLWLKIALGVEMKSFGNEMKSFFMFGERVNNYDVQCLNVKISCEL